MIFAVWFFPWVMLAQTPLHFVVPISALLVRAYFVEGFFPALPKLVVLPWMLIAAISVMGDPSLPLGVVIFLQLAICSVALKHLLDRTRQSRAVRLPAVRQVFVYFTRFFSVLLEYLREIQYWNRVRRTRSEAGWVRARFTYLVSAGRVALLEVNLLRQRAEAVVVARGGDPENADWMYEHHPRGAWHRLALGDICVLALAISPAALGIDALVPGHVVALIWAMPETMAR